jgi:hypothetical protein
MVINDDAAADDDKSRLEVCEFCFGTRQNNVRIVCVFCKFGVSRGVKRISNSNDARALLHSHIQVAQRASNK